MAHVRAKAWKKGEPEPDAWTIEGAHPDGHTHGSPGLFGFSPARVVRRIRGKLAKLPVESLMAFEDHLARSLHALDTQAHFEAWLAGGELAFS